MRTRRWYVLAAAIFVAASGAGCGSCDPLYQPTAPTSVTPSTASAEITPRQQAANVGETATFTGKINGSLASGASTVNVNWSLSEPGQFDTTKATISATDPITQTITVTCKAAGAIIVQLSGNGIDTATASLTCNAPATTTPPSIGPTVESIIGSYTKHGKRTSGTCTPPLFDAEWDAAFIVSKSAEGNLGIVFNEQHTGQDGHGGSFFVTFPYSQLTASPGPNGELILASGSPERDIPPNGPHVITHIEVTFKSDGSFNGTETFVGPGGCVETYELSGKRK